MSETSQSSQVAIILVFIEPPNFFIISKKNSPGIRKPCLDFRDTSCFSNECPKMDYTKKGVSHFAFFIKGVTLYEEKRMIEELR